MFLEAQKEHKVPWSSESNSVQVFFHFAFFFVVVFIQCNFSLLFPILTYTTGVKTEVTISYGGTEMGW